jgi:GNAT superfamily N-acetyltransferase
VLQVRPATAADRDRVIQIALACDPEDWLPESFDDFLHEESMGLGVAEVEGRIIGCFAYEWDPARRQAYLMGMRVDPAVQGQGLGSAFCKAQIDWLTGMGAERLTLLSEQRNERAHRTVERHGFVKTVPWLIYHLSVADLRSAALVAAEPFGLAAALQGEAPAPPTPELRQWWADRTAGAYAATPGSGWIIFPLSPADWGGDGLLCLGTEGALLWGRNEEEWFVRWASGSPGALRSLLATFAQLAQAGGAAQLTLSLPGQVEPLLQEAGLTLPEPWRAFLFVYTSQPHG